MPGFATTGRREMLAGLLLFLVAASLDAQTGRDSIYGRANQAYESGDFARAEKEYSRIVEAGSASADLYFNLGNAVYRQDRPGEAALWYRRALVLDPRMAEARQNLKVVQHVGGYPEFKPEGVDLFLNTVAAGEIVSVLTAAIWLALLAGSAALVFRKRLRRWRPLLIMMTILGTAAAILTAWSMIRYRAHVAITNQAIVIANEAAALTGPFPDAEKVIDLPPGTELRFLERRGPWSFVAIPKDLRGWVRSEAIAPIVPDAAEQQE